MNVLIWTLNLQFHSQKLFQAVTAAWWTAGPLPRPLSTAPPRGQGRHVCDDGGGETASFVLHHNSVNTKDLQQSGAICWNTAIRCFNVTAISLWFWIDYRLIGVKWWRRRVVLMWLEVEAGLQSSSLVSLVFMPCEKIRVCVIKYVQNLNEALNNRRTLLPAGAPHCRPRAHVRPVEAETRARRRTDPSGMKTFSRSCEGHSSS